MFLINVGLLLAGFYFGFVFNLNVLTENFFDNLQGDPLLLAEEHLTESSKEFIEAQINNYVDLVTNQKNVQQGKQKRSLLDDITRQNTGAYILDGLTSIATIPVQFPRDIQIFEYDRKIFAAALQSSDKKKDADSMIIFSYENHTFSEIHRVPVENATKISIINHKNAMFIVVAENAPLKNLSAVYQFHSTLVKIQSIEMHYAGDIVLWKMHNELYMSVAQFMSNKYEIEIPLYKWLGRHFDLVQSIPSKGVKKVTPFEVDNWWFLAVANFRDDMGQTKLYSEIYKFDYHLEKFVLYQRILTKACTDIEVFHLEENERERDTFLVVANSYKVSNGTVDYETESIIYKFVDQYFIPFQSILLNAVEEWTPVRGPDHEFILLASTTFSGLKAFQYDGWSFKQVPLDINPVAGPGLKSIRPQHFQNRTTIVISNKNNQGTLPNVFALKFKHEKTLNELYTTLTTWCEEGLKKTEALTNGDLFEIVLGQRADVDEDNEFENITDRIKALDLQLDEINIDTEVPKSITADNIIFNNITIMTDLKTIKMNDHQMDQFFENIYNIDDTLDFDTIVFDTLKVEEDIRTDTVNGHPIDTLMHSDDDLSLGSVLITGTLTVPEGIIIDGDINGVQINNQLLLRTGDQEFQKSIEVDELTLGQLNVATINGKNLTTMVGKKTFDKINYVKSLVVKNLTIGGYINDVDLPTLDKYALRKTGDQFISSDFTFEEIVAKNVETKSINGRDISHLVPINKKVSLKQDLVFKNDVMINKLTIEKSLNDIKVINGKLDVLLKNAKEEQEILSDKIFADVIIYQAIQLQGRINSTNLEKMNPLVTIDKEVFLQGDKFLDHLQIESFVSAKDIISTSGHYSMVNLESKGLRLDRKEIKPKLNFLQQLNVDQIFVDKINGRNINDFVIIGLEDTQMIEAPKTFIQNLFINGTSHVMKINHVDVDDLENKILKIDGNQTVIGKHRVKSVITDTNSTKFDTNMTVNSNDSLITNNLSVDLVKAKNILVSGYVNDFAFDHLMNDTVMNNSTKLIRGHKYFENLKVDHLSVVKGVDIDIPDKFDNITIDGPIAIDKINIKTIEFEKDCNNITKKQFGQKPKTIKVDGDNFDTLIIFGNTIIDNQKINHVEVNELVHNTVKIDEAHEFETATFEQIISSTVNLEGQVENFDFDNVVTGSSDIVDTKIFDNSLTINGSVDFKSEVNNLNLTQFCQFVMGQINHKNLTIFGNAFFAKGPNVVKINNLDVKSVKDRAWFNNEDCTLSGSINFDDIIFENDVNLGGFLDDVNLHLLRDNYLSKSKNQNITATFTFDNDLIFENNVTVPKMTILDGLVNDVNVDELVRTTLIDDYDQVFETPVFLEKVFVKNLTGDFTVNGLQLDRDVMRYDKVNMITGPKNFENLKINFLKLDRDINIQNVNVLDWMKNSVLKTTGSNVTGHKVFKNAKFLNGLYVAQTFNGLIFDQNNILLKDTPQDITGVKTFKIVPSATMDFKNLKLKGLINGVTLSELIKNQAFKNQNNIFKTSLNLYNNITTQNLVIKKLYQGVNITELISNVTRLGVLNNLLEQYEKLLGMSYEIKNAVEGQAYYLHHYKIIQTIPLVDNSRKIVCPDGITRIGVLSNKNPQMNLYGWDSQKEQFIINATITFEQRPDYVTQTFNGQYLYTESSTNSGHFIKTTNFHEEKLKILTNITLETVSFKLSQQELCTLFIYYNARPQLFCIQNDNILLKQLFQSPNALKATTFKIGEKINIAMITQSNAATESHIDIWRYNTTTAKFQIHQSIFEAHPKSVTCIKYKTAHFLAIASGHLQNAMYSGRVEIRKYDETTSKFASWQSIEINAPIQVEFDILATNELVLYVLSESPIVPFQVFRYEGVAGFRLSFTGSALPELKYMSRLESGMRSFILAQSYEEMVVVEAVFKGERVK